MKAILTYIIIGSILFVPGWAGSQKAQGANDTKKTVQLALCPAKAAYPVQKYRLLAEPNDADSDALLIYRKAAKSLPRNFDTDNIDDWCKVPAKNLPRAQVKATLKRFKPTLELMEKATRCESCRWPPVDPGSVPMMDLSDFRKLARILALKVRFHISQGQYDEAIHDLGTGLAMARHIAEGPTLVESLVGTAVAAIMLVQLEQWVQAPEAPNLYHALKELPAPFIDMSMKPSHARAQQVIRRLDRQIAALQCLEALRHYAARHKGKLPEALNDITDVDIPDDTLTIKPFAYRCAGGKAILEALPPEGGLAKDALRYEISIKK